MAHRVTTAIRMGGREFRRMPALLGLLVFLPVYVIGVFVWLVPDRTVPLTLDGGLVSVELAAFAAAFMTPVTVAILSGIVGLFLMRSSRAADGRLRLAGYRPWELVAARFGLLTVGTLVVTAAALAVALLAFTPESLAAFAIAALLAGLTYGTLGVAVGVALDRLPGVYVLLFAPMVDILMFQNPLASDPPAWTAALPGHYATALLFDAGFTGNVDLVDAVGAVGYALVLLCVASVLLYRTTAVD